MKKKKESSRATLRILLISIAVIFTALVGVSNVVEKPQKVLADDKTTSSVSNNNTQTNLIENSNSLFPLNFNDALDFSKLKQARGIGIVNGGRTLNNNNINVYNSNDTSTWLPNTYQHQLNFDNISTSAYNTSGGLNVVTSNAPTSAAPNDQLVNPTGVEYDWKGFKAVYGTGINKIPVDLGMTIKNINYDGTPIDMKIAVDRIDLPNYANSVTQAQLDTLNSNLVFSLSWTKSYGIYGVRFLSSGLISSFEYKVYFYKSGTTTPIDIKTSFMFGDQEGVLSNGQPWSFPSGTSSVNYSSWGEQFVVKNADGNSKYPRWDFLASNGQIATNQAFVPDLGATTTIHTAVAKYNENESTPEVGNQALPGAIRIYKGFSYVQNGVDTYSSKNVNASAPLQAQWSFLFNGSESELQEHATSDTLALNPTLTTNGATNYTDSNLYHNFLFLSSIEPSLIIPPKKYVSDADEKLVTSNTLSDTSENYNYTLEGNFPQQNYVDFELKSYKVTDTIPEGVELSGGDVSKITAYFTDSAGTNNGDATSYFDYSYDASSRLLTISAKATTLTNLDLYSKYSKFRFNIPVHIIDATKVERDQNGKIQIHNSTTQSGTYFNGQAFSDDSNQVVTTAESHLKISKSVDKTKAEVGTIDPLNPNDPNLQGINYSVNVTNPTSVTTMDNLRLLDILPFGGDDRGSVFNKSGAYDVTQLSLVDSSGKAVSNARIYFKTIGSSLPWITGTNYDPNKLPGESDLIANGWVKYTGTQTIGGTAAVVAYIDNLPANSTYTLKIAVNNSNNIGADIFNNASVNTIVNEVKTSNKVETKIYGRNLTGTVWYDDNMNGLKDNDENPVSNVPVKLYRTTQDPSVTGTDIAVTQSQTGQKFVDDNGNSVIVTDNKGNYEFDNLSEGTYQVDFEINGQLQSKVFQVTKQLANSTLSDEINSKVKTGTNQITDSPAAGSPWSHQGPLLKDLSGDNTTNGIYSMNYNNLGIVRTAKLEIFKYKTGTLDDINGDGSYDSSEIAAATSLPGASFEIYKGKLETLPDNRQSDTRFVATGTTNEQGNLNVDSNLFAAYDENGSPTPQTYTVFETQAPAGYELAKKGFYFDVSPNDVDTTIHLFIDNENATELPYTGSSSKGQLIFILALSTILVAMISMSFIYIDKRIA